MHPLGGPHPEPAALAGQRLYFVGPYPGGVDDHMPTDVGHRAVLGVANRDPDHPIALGEQRNHLGRGAHHRAIVRRCAGDHHGVPSVVDHCVVVADAADQRAAFESGRQPQRTGPGQVPLGRNGFRATKLVVEEDAGGDIGPFPDPVGQWEEERQRLDQMRRERGQ